MIVGSILCTFAMLLLGFTRPFASIFSSPASALVSLLPVPLPSFALTSVPCRTMFSLFGSPLSPSSPLTSPSTPVCPLVALPIYHELPTLMFFPQSRLSTAPSSSIPFPPLTKPMLMPGPPECLASVVLQVISCTSSLQFHYPYVFTNIPEATLT